MFALYYSSETKKIRALNGSGRAASEATLDMIRKDLEPKYGNVSAIPMLSVHAVTTPGAAAGWMDVVEQFGNQKLSMEQILDPAIHLAERGFPVSELASTFVSCVDWQTIFNHIMITCMWQWQNAESMLREASPNFAELLKTDPTAKDGCRAPRPGELFKNPALANTFRLLAKHGKKGFYEGPVAESVIEIVRGMGGHLSLGDLRDHAKIGSEMVEPVSIKFSGQNISQVQHQYLDSKPKEGDESDRVEVWECPPNGQGIVALMALGILEILEKQGKIKRFDKSDHNCAESET